METRAERLTFARKQARLDRPAAAERLKLPYSTYAAHENGSRDFGLDEAQVYAHAFRVNVVWLMFGTGSPKGPSIEQKILSLPEDKRRQVEDFIEFLGPKPQP